MKECEKDYSNFILQLTQKKNLSLYPNHDENDIALILSETYMIKSLMNAFLHNKL